MFLEDGPINYLAILMAAITYFIIGAIWYAPGVFGNRWKHEGEGHDECAHSLSEHPKCRRIGSYIGEFIIALIMAAILNLFIQISLADEVREGLLVALWIWIGFIATTHFSAVLWGRKTIKSFFIHAGFMLVGLLAMGAVIIIFENYL